MCEFSNILFALLLSLAEKSQINKLIVEIGYQYKQCSLLLSACVIA